VTLEYAGLARGDDPGLNAAVVDVADRLSQQLDGGAGLKVES
jgi:hypothetical protein